MIKRTKDDYINLLHKHFPKLKFKEVKMIKHGWDHDVLVLDEKWIFRFPKRREYLKRFKAEVQLLQYLKDKVNIPTPHYEYLTDDMSFGGYKILKGKEMRPYLLRKLSHEKRRKIAKQLGTFMGIVHKTPTQFAEKIGFTNPEEGHWYCQNAVGKRLKKINKILFPKLNAQEREWVTKKFEEYTSFAPQIRHAVVHGDFVADHILFDFEKGTVTGVIDFADVEVGDPELEFGGLWGYGTQFVKNVAAAYPLELGPNWEEKSKFPMRTHMVWGMYEILKGVKMPITFEKCRKELKGFMKSKTHKRHFTRSNIVHDGELS